jgi:hypothetical protein
MLEEKQKHRAKLPGWLSTGCALALICACILPSEAFAQSSNTASNPMNATSKPSTAKPKAKPASSNNKQTQAAAHTKSAAATTARNSKSKQTTSRGYKGKSKKKTARGQQKIDPERAQAIQVALIREHYLSGTAAGTWNQSCEDAMRRYQADHGWQSKTVPDSRALISLGLGPSHDHLLNPDSAMTTGPSAPRAASLTPASHSAEPGARMSAPTTSVQDGSGPQ